MTRTELAEKETSAQVVGRTETMTLTTETPKEGLTMTIEDAKKAKRRPTREQKARWKTNALMRKYDDETKTTALRVYTEALDYGKVKVEATLDQTEEAVRNYLCGDWTFDDLWDLAREFGVKPRGFHDNSWDMGEGYDGQIIDRLSDIISKIGFRLREEEGLAEKQAEASEAEASGSGEKTETTKEEKPMKKVTVKELRAEARELGIKGYSRMTKAELKETLLMAEVEYAARDGESMKQTTIEELRTEAKEFGVVGYKRMTRVELVKRLSDLRKMFPSELEEKADEAETQKTCDESLARYEEVRSAYKEYYDAQGDYVESDPADEGLKDKADKAYSRYLKALSEYRSGEMSEREETVRRIRDICETTYWPLERLLAKGIDWLIEISHKCGINAAHYKRMSERDMAIRLLREAGIETRAETFYERFQRQRKELQKELHELWVKRHAIRKAQHMFEENSPEYEALSGVWEESYKAEADELMEEYQTIIEHLKEERRQAA
jgi:hypothetical protein